jgi:hypothetical protein
MNDTNTTVNRPADLRHRPDTASPVAGRRAIGMLSMAVLLLLAVGMAGCGERPAPSDGPVAPGVTTEAVTPAPAAAAEPGAEVLQGRWMRPDGGYVLEIKSATGAGPIEAAYFNPSPIHVAQAVVTREGDHWKLFVELRDVNYPGSTYRLAYDPSVDMLKGEYYQAVARETYPIYFVRLKR